MRARGIKPGFFTNGDLVQLPALTRLLFIGLWCVADREGRLKDEPFSIKLAVLPGDECDVAEMLLALVDKGFIQRYEVDGGRYIQVLNFAKHQTPHIKERDSVIPAPCLHETSPVQTPDQHPLTPDSGLLTPDSGLLIPDGNGGKPPALVDNELLDELLDVAAGVRSKKAAWHPNEADRHTLAALTEQFPPEQLRREMGKFKAYCPQRDYSQFGRTFASWMNRVTPEPMVAPKPTARLARIEKARAQLAAGMDEGTVRNMVLDETEWRAVTAGIGRPI